MFQRARELFIEASRLPPEERGTFLDDRCDDPALRREVDSLLAADASPAIDDSLVSGFSVGEIAAGSAALPRRIGPYRVLSLLGEGGMGVVYLAQQESPSREIALKVVRGGVGSPSLLRRFEHEAEILGRLRHPGIAQVYDAGTAQTPMGPQPFFAMELVRGEPLHRFVANQKSDLRTRLALFAKICDAVQHAHHRGILHRDLKPANILVERREGGELQPRVLDFGVARIVREDGPHRTRYTAAGQMIGTVGYMSPEQLGADPGSIDTRSDVYSLGVILYELLAGRPPHNIADTPPHVAIRRVQEEEPTSITRFDPAFRGDLDTVVRKAMERDPARRYESASELAADVRHYLAREPIGARPPTTWYLFAKFARRNRELVAAASIALLTLLGAVIVSTTLAISENSQRREADRHTYFASLGAAESAIANDDPESAKRYLEAAPAHLRGWEWRHLLSRLHQSLATMDCGSGVHEASLSPDGTVVAAACDDGSVQLWDHRTESRVSRFIAHDGAARSVVFSGDGARIVTAGDDGAVSVWSLPQGELAHTRRFESAVHLVRVSPDGQQILALVAWDNHTRLELLDVQTLESLSTRIDRPDTYTDAVALSPDGSLLALAGGRYALDLHDLTTGALVARFDNLPWEVTSIEWSRDGKRVYAAIRSREILGWDVTTGERLVETGRHLMWISDLAVSSDAALIASVSDDRSVRLWDARTGDRDRVLLGHAQPVRSVVFLPDGHSILTASLDGTMRTWPLEDRDVLRGHTRYVYDVAISPDSERVATASWDLTLRMWNPANGTPVSILPIGTNGHCLEYSPDGSILSVGRGGSAGVLLLDTTSWEEIACLPAGESIAARFSPDGSRLAYLSGDGEQAHFIRIVETETWQQVAEHVIEARFSYQGDLQFIDDQRLVLSGIDPYAWIIDARTGAVLARTQKLGGAARRMAVSPTHNTVALACEDGLVYLLDDRTLAVKETLVGHSAEVYTVTFSPDGQRIATGSNDSTVRIWDASSGKHLLTLRGHEDYVYGLEFTPDGRTLISASGDQTARMWRTTPPSSP